MDGIISQVERFANQTVYSKLTTDIFDRLMDQMSEKAEKMFGNKFIFVVNKTLWYQIQSTLREYLRDWQTVGTFLFSQKAGGDVEVGTKYDTYSFAGNTITFMVDKALSIEYPTKGYGLCLDLSADATTGRPAISMMTLKGQEFITAFQKGIGGKSGKESGEVSSWSEASRWTNLGWSGVLVACP